MPNKRKRDTSSDIIRKKIRKLESQLKEIPKQYNRLIIYTDSEDEGSDEDRNDNCSEERSVDPIFLRALSPTRSCGIPVPDTDAVATAAPGATPAPASAVTPPATSLDLPSTSQADGNVPVNITDDTDPELDNEILALLGDAPKSDIKLGKATHKELASRWQEILDKGLPKELKDKIVEAYLIPENCSLLVPPILNPEVKVALADNLVKRDTALLAKQKQLSVAISALNQAIELAIAKEPQTSILKPLSDACRLMCDSHFVDTRTRRGFVISAINHEMKETLNESKRDKLLFGENVSEKLKSAKSVQRSAADLKQTRHEPNRSHVFKKNNFLRPNRNVGNNYLNWKTMPRKITPRADWNDRARQPQRPGPNSGSQRRETSERPSTSRGWSANRRR